MLECFTMSKFCIYSSNYMYMYNNNIKNQIFIILFLETMHERVHMSAWISYMLMNP